MEDKYDTYGSVYSQIRKALTHFKTNNCGDVIELYNDKGKTLYEVIDDILTHDSEVQQYDINEGIMLDCPIGTLGYISFAWVTKLHDFYLESLLWQNTKG